MSVFRLVSFYLGLTIITKDKLSFNALNIISLSVDFSNKIHLQASLMNLNRDSKTCNIEVQESVSTT